MLPLRLPVSRSTAAAAAAAASSGASTSRSAAAPLAATARGLVTFNSSTNSSTNSSSGRRRQQEQRPPPSSSLARPGGRIGAAAAAAAAGGGAGSRRGVFTYPAPRKLSDIMKVPLVRKCDPLEIQEMWQEYHRERKDALAMSVPASQFRLLKDRARVSRVFLYPVFRDKGYMTLISQYQDTCFLLTFLEDFRKNPQAATPWMCLTLYDEFLGDKGLGLLRGDVSHHLTREEGQALMTSLLEHYTHEDKYRRLYQFNHEPQKFSFEKYVREAPRPPPPKPT